MVRHTDADDEESTKNDATRFVHTVVNTQKAVESHDVVTDASGHHTAECGMFGTGGDFDDDGMFTGDEAHAVVRFTVDADAPAYQTHAVVDGLAEDGWSVERERTKASYSAPVDRSGTFDQPAQAPPEDESKKNHRAEYVARKRVDGNQ